MISNRRNFIKRSLLSLASFMWGANGFAFNSKAGAIMSVNGKIKASDMGLTLTHEHILVDFQGATGDIWWDHVEVLEVVIPHLLELKKYGCKTFFEFTPSFIGKDVKLLKKLAAATDMQLVTNTGYYGANSNKHIPKHAYQESAAQLADRWIMDFEKGMQGTSIRPGFIKTGVNPGPLSEFHKKLIKAAALTHLKTGLTIASHTGLAEPALEQIEILKENGVHPRAFIWTHAQNEDDLSTHSKAASESAWVSLDNVSKQNTHKYVEMIQNLKQSGYLDRILLSHDAGWYSPGETKGGEFRGYTAVFEHLIPALKKEGITSRELDQILIHNPAQAFSIGVKPYKA